MRRNCRARKLFEDVEVDSLGRGGALTRLRVNARGWKRNRQHALGAKLRSRRRRQWKQSPEVTMPVYPSVLDSGGFWCGNPSAEELARWRRAASSEQAMPGGERTAVPAMRQSRSKKGQSAFAEDRAGVEKRDGKPQAYGEGGSRREERDAG